MATVINQHGLAVGVYFGWWAHLILYNPNCEHTCFVLQQELHKVGDPNVVYVTMITKSDKINGIA